ncbi:MAG: hypothetical protein AAFV53_38870 [Myxococcota bacterium]
MRSLLALALLTACGPKNNNGNEGVADLVSNVNERPTEDGLTEQSIDINKDGAPDVFNYYRGEGRMLVRKDVDLNWDGRVDIRTWFDAAGEMEKEEMDGDFDGNFDWVDLYQSGKRVLSKVDTDYDGQYDLYKIFESGKVRRKERDTDGDGNIDFWEYLDETGQVVKTGRDIDGDGVMDVRED